MSFLKLLLEALFSSLIDGLRAYQADQNLKALGYAQAERDAATDHVKADNAVIAAQQKMAAIAPPSRDDVVNRLRDGSF